MHKNSQKPCYERVAQDAMQMILIMRVKKLYKPTQHKSYPFSMYCSHAFGGEQRFIEEVCCYEKFESQPALARQILLAMVLGILLGSYLHYHSDSREWLIANLLSPAGDIFIHLIKMIVVPIVISTLIVGIAGVGDAKQLGRIGAKTILYFELITTVAIILGITLANVFQPGSGIDMSQLATVDISKYQNTTAEVQSHAHGLMGTILSLVPTNIIASMAKGDMLPIIFFSVLFGLGLSSLPATHREPLVTVFRSISETMFKVTHMVMRYAPVGVFALIAVTVANFGFASLWPLAKLVLLVHFAIIFFALVVLGIVARLCGLSIWILIRILKDELILAYSTASSESVLPRIIEKMEAYGAPASITSFVVPTGYSFNLDGSTLYQSIAAIFIAQLYGIDLSLWQEIVLVLTLMVTSKGIAGVPAFPSWCYWRRWEAWAFRWKGWRLSLVSTVSSTWRVLR